jgi:hypothetical protein
VAPYEESFQLGDVKDVRFASVSYWQSEDPDVSSTTSRCLGKADEQSDDIVSSVRIYLKRRPVHPEAHSGSRSLQVDRFADYFQGVTATVLVQDDHQTHVLGVNNLCRPGTLRPCLGKATSRHNADDLEPVAGKIDPGDSEWFDHSESSGVSANDTGKHGSMNVQKNEVSYPDILSNHFDSCPRDSQLRKPRGMLILPTVLINSCLVSRTFVIEAVLRIQDAVFDPSTMQPNKLSPVRGVLFH